MGTLRAQVMTILVTGGAGYIGSHMVHALVESGESVVVLDNLSTGFKWAVPRDVALVIGETGDDAAVSRLIAEREVSAIIHFAASIVVPDSMGDPSERSIFGDISKLCSDCTVDSHARLARAKTH
jgi:UDP-glucose 4-epimerase